MPPEPFDLQACVRRVVEGDAAAAHELVARVHPQVSKLVRAHRPRRVAAEDLIQDVFLKMFTQLQRYEARAGQPFEGWLARLALRTLSDALRGETRRADGVPLSPGAGEWLHALAGAREPSAEDALAARELVEVLLGELAPEDRLVIVLLDLEQRSTAEIAALTGWSRARVKVRAFRARMRLRAAVARLEEREHG